MRPTPGTRGHSDAMRSEMPLKTESSNVDVPALMAGLNGVTAAGLNACKRFVREGGPWPEGVLDVVKLPWGGVKLVYDDGQDVVMGGTPIGFVVCVGACRQRRGSPPGT